ncbi:UDP-N-acetylglucosamine 2-epimerase (non-hydrolyzing) [Chryseobacterium taklimakanense]|uniref:non-hydrolyzing UDP-N-acetylglucosamine 2-epimerase n=1 Tax=Chryseobacterium taklimakanense TaxID=536441 RepID=UPI001EF550F9|nr:UDP-N-acetylglucosamine 2-epimerase (non-hydrolyzing) [Chryseobacterium taklimakanense]MCG7280441.1 UDP-N-acetylglucosamine 2-epimerase (non-hydrolyzing) [Chryseobacterium taklimakanense]
MKILTILGARPQFIKAAVLSNEITSHNGIEEIIVHTGQHYDKNMSDVFFNDMRIPCPKYNLEVKSKFHGEMTGMMMAEIEKVAIKENPDWILVYGDTNSTLAGALVATKLHIKLAHVEAGLRSYNMEMPEEVNRILTDRISDILFCPSNAAVKNLEKEGFGNMGKKIEVVGDIMFDSALHYSKFNSNLQFDLPSDYLLSTIHRAENTTPEKLAVIFGALNKIGAEHKIILPIHPRTKSILANSVQDLETSYPNILFIEPQGYLEMLSLIRNSKMVITDSGGLQKEAYFFQKPCLTLRDQTEWIELVEQGYNKLSPISETDILANYKLLISTDFKFNKYIYGEGNTAEKIVNSLKNFTK